MNTQQILSTKNRSETTTCGTTDVGESVFDGDLKRLKVNSEVFEKKEIDFDRKAHSSPSKSMRESNDIFGGISQVTVRGKKVSVTPDELTIHYFLFLPFSPLPYSSFHFLLSTSFVLFKNSNPSLFHYSIIVKYPHHASSISIIIIAAKYINLPFKLHFLTCILDQPCV
jgi:hypothetical protein